MGHGTFDMRIRRSLHGDKSENRGLCVCVCGGGRGGG